jgi:signal transduction histidine kinase
MPLDNRTLYAALMITSSVMAVALCAFWRAYPSVRGIRTFASAIISVSAGALLIALRDVAPDFLSILMSDLLLLGGIILAAEAFRARCALPSRSRFELSVLGVEVATVLYFYAVPSVLARVVAFSAATAAVLGVASYDLLRVRHRAMRRGARGVGITFGLLALFMAARATFSPVQGEIPSFVTTDRWLQIVPTIIGIVLTIGLGLAFMAMAFAEADRALHQANDDLRRSNAELDRFAAVVSHDLKAPLNNVIGFLDLVIGRLTRNGDPTSLGHATEARQCALQMNALIGDLLAYARLREAAVEKFVAVDLAGVCRRALDSFAQRVAECEATVEVASLPTVAGERSQLLRLFQNLIDNAIKYRSPERPLRITIGASRDGPEWKVFVADNGLGVPAAEQARIFEPFRRAGNASEIEGTGFGLAISRLIVERHGGRLWVESEPGVGSTFAFTVPGSGDPSTTAGSAKHACA